MVKRVARVITLHILTASSYSIAEQLPANLKHTETPQTKAQDCFALCVKRKCMLHSHFADAVDFSSLTGESYWVLRWKSEETLKNEPCIYMHVNGQIYCQTGDSLAQVTHSHTCINKFNVNNNNISTVCNHNLTFLPLIPEGFCVCDIFNLNYVDRKYTNL